MRETHLTLLTEDRHPLAATLFEPDTAPRAAILLNSATAVPRRYYRPYASFLAQRGFAVLTYDYRGIGQSQSLQHAPRRLRMRQWGERDLPAVLRWLHERYPGLAIGTVGHSVGGQILGLAPNNHLVKAALGIAAQSAYWRNWPPVGQVMVLASMGLLVPACVRLFGKLPAAVLGGEVPGGIALQWAHWCLQPGYITDRKGTPIRTHFQSFRGRMRFYAIADDWVFAPLKAVSALAEFFPRAQREVRVIDPASQGVKRMGHFGFFRPDTPEALWQRTADWLEQALDLDRPQLLEKAA